MATIRASSAKAVDLRIPSVGPWILHLALFASAMLLRAPVTRADDAQADRARAVAGARGTYGLPPRAGKDHRVDIPRLLDELSDQRANTYHWLVHARPTDWDDLKLFLPKAREKGIRVWVTICPPSEQPPKNASYSEPYRLDFERWAVEIAKLSVAEPNLVAWSFDDFTHNLSILTPERMRGVVKGARDINPRLAFVPCCYFPKIQPKFIEDYRDVLDGLLFPYRAESAKANLTDPSLVASEVKKIKAIAGPSLPVIVDVYATRHSSLGDSTPEYVRAVMADAWKSADGVLVYCHQDPKTNADKYNVIKELFHEWAKSDHRADDGPRPKIARPHLADYDAEPRLPNGRVDVDRLTARLKELGATTYYWLIYHAPTDWDDLKLFLPKAKEAGIEVWVYLVPPTESAPRLGNSYMEPFRLDYPRWAEEIARLSVEHPNLTAWVIDDFYANHDLFTPAYLRKMRERSRPINPRLAFLPLMYFGEMRESFIEDYREVIDGVVVAYLEDRASIDWVWQLTNDAVGDRPAEFGFPPNTPSEPGDFVLAAQEVVVRPADRRIVRFRERDDFVGPTSGYHFKQLLVDGEVAWEEDVAGGLVAWEPVEVDVSQLIGGKDRVTLAFRLIDKKGVGNFNARWYVGDLKAEGLEPAAGLDETSKWSVTKQGAFGTSFGRVAKPGQRTFKIPFISMVAGQAVEFRLRHGDPASPERMANQLRLSLQARRDGKCDGVVIYCLDKRPNSKIFPLARDLFREFGE